MGMASSAPVSLTGYFSSISTIRSSLFPYELAEFPCGGLRLVRSTVRK